MSSRKVCSRWQLVSSLGWGPARSMPRCDKQKAAGWTNFVFIHPVTFRLSHLDVDLAGVRPTDGTGCHRQHTLRELINIDRSRYQRPQSSSVRILRTVQKHMRGLQLSLFDVTPTQTPGRSIPQDYYWRCTREVCGGAFNRLRISRAIIPP